MSVHTSEVTAEHVDLISAVSLVMMSKVVSCGVFERALSEEPIRTVDSEKRSSPFEFGLALGLE